MRHLREGRKFNRTASHRKAMLANLAVSVIDKERVTTTVQKAKEARRLVERLITYGKRNTVSSVRLAGRHVRDKSVLKKLFSDVAPSYSDREGGYVRIVKTNERKGDNAEMCILELVGRTQTGERPAVARRNASQKTAPKKTGAVAAAAAGKPAEASAEGAAEEAATKQTDAAEADTAAAAGEPGGEETAEQQAAPEAQADKGEEKDAGGGETDDSAAKTDDAGAEEKTDK